VIYSTSVVLNDASFHFLHSTAIIIVQKDLAYKHFRRLDQRRIEQMQALITDHERRLVEFGRLEAHEHRALLVAKARTTKLLSETVEETQERYADLYDAMLSEHASGLNDLDFSRTGL
jgi:hypothetical protein